MSFPLSAGQVAELLGERGIDVSARTLLTWTQTFGPNAARRHRRRIGRRWYIDEYGHVVHVRLRKRRELVTGLKSPAPKAQVRGH